MVTKKVPVMAVPPVGTPKGAAVTVLPAKAEEPKQDAPPKKKAGSKKKAEPGILLSPQKQTNMLSIHIVTRQDAQT